MGVEGSNLDPPKASAGYTKRLPEANPDTQEAQRNQRNIGSVISSPPPKESNREKIDLSLKPDPYKDYKDIVSIGKPPTKDENSFPKLPEVLKGSVKATARLFRAKAPGVGIGGTF